MNAVESEPPTVVTVICWTPALIPAGTVTSIDDSVLFAVCAGVPPTVTVAPERPAPVTVTVDPRGPEVGLTVIEPGAATSVNV